MRTRRGAVRQRALLAGLRRALSRPPGALAVLAVDMPRLTPATVDRLLAAAEGHDGAFLVDADGRRQLAGVLDPRALERARPADPFGLPWHRLMQTFDLADVAPVGDEARDVDTWADLRDLGRRPTERPLGNQGLRDGPSLVNVVPVNLHDWIDELCDTLDVETEVDEALILDLAAATRAQRGEDRGARDGVPARVRGWHPAMPTPKRSRRSPPAPRRWPRAGTVPPTRPTPTTSTTSRSPTTAWSTTAPTSYVV